MDQVWQLHLHLSLHRVQSIDEDLPAAAFASSDFRMDTNDTP